nr:hypothetical protein Iba_chr04dCG10120 [Ipomoea batatas]
MIRLCEQNQCVKQVLQSCGPDLKHSYNIHSSITDSEQCNVEEIWEENAIVEREGMERKANLNHYRREIREQFYTTEPKGVIGRSVEMWFWHLESGAVTRGVHLGLVDYEDRSAHSTFSRNGFPLIPGLRFSSAQHTGNNHAILSISSMLGLDYGIRRKRIVIL